MPSVNVVNIEHAVIATLPPDRIPGEDVILELAWRIRAVFPVTDDEFDEVIHSLHARLQITMDVGVVLEEDHQSWLPARKPEIEPYYWGRYAQFLERNESWPPRVLATLDAVTDEILDLLGNPELKESWRRRGLVMGDVQSGKTATYTALCCKAADAGYRMIILLTGMQENLRRQTQERLDLGFVGLDSSGLLSQQRITREIGVGTIDRRKMVGVFTSRATDFRSALMNQLGFRLSSFNDPVLVVIKKNGRILENLINWLRSYNADDNGRIDMPMLLIDDEADNASINTHSPDQDPTTINERIRALLQLFIRSSYVGFTATPFANIFIDPDSESDMLGNDIFPRDFIYSLDTPSNYIGANEIFGDEPVLVNCLRQNRDAENIFPPSHKSDLVVQRIPATLHEALLAFILTNAIRDLREERAPHRSMLVNVSHLTAVQDQVVRLLDEQLRRIQQDIRNYSQLDPEEACLNGSLRSLRKVWEDEFAHCGFEWAQIQKILPRAALPVVVKAVNKNTGAASLDYAANRESGLRVVVVGGHSLSRGMTLYGLCISYFFRNSQMYDTLMQMGRWFGYRDGYEDLVRVWMTEEAMHWYAHISLASNELRDEIGRMKALGLTPKEFGLKVRAHPDSLIVTARNKQRTAQTIERLISVSMQGIETPRLHSDPDIIKANALATERFLQRMEGAEISPQSSPWNNTIWKYVPKKYIVDLLREFTAHPLNLHFQAENLARTLERTDVQSLDLWDVVLPNGSEEEDVFAGVSYRAQRRAAERRGRERSDSCFRLQGTSGIAGD